MNRRIHEYEDTKAEVSFVFVNDMQFYIDFCGYKFEGLMPIKMGKELKKKAKVIDFVVTNTTTSSYGRTIVPIMNTFAVKGINKIVMRG